MGQRQKKKSFLKIKKLEGRNFRYDFPSWDYPRSLDLKKKKECFISNSESEVHSFISSYFSF
jgi:hypothetical protein